MNIARKFLLFFLAAVWSLGTLSTANAVPVQWAGNGHWYDLITLTNVTWDVARQDALSLNTSGFHWDLATITSEGEQAFIQSLIPSTLPQTTTGVVEYWVGGYQNSGAAEPGGAWNWINNEGMFWNSGTTGIYSNWQSGEPNNSSPGEGHLALDSRYGWRWNDNTPYINGYIFGYIAEIIAVPEPSTMLLLGIGFVGFALGTRKRSEK